MDVPGRGVADSYSVLADKAFPLCPEVITPYKGGQVPLTQEEQDFNSHMNSVRQVQWIQDTESLPYYVLLAIIVPWDMSTSSEGQGDSHVWQH